MPGSHTLWLVSATPTYRLHAVRACRAASRRLGETDLLRPIIHLVDRCIEQTKPQLIGRGAESDIFDARCEFDSIAGQHATCAVDLTPEQVFATEDGEIPNPPAISEAPSGDSENPVRSPEAFKAAMVMLAMGNGSPNAALAGSNSLRNATGDEDFWQDVVGAILDTFPILTVIAGDDG